MKLRQPNVAALLNNVYALPVFTLAAVFCEGLDLGVVEFASNVLPVLLQALRVLLRPVLTMS